MKKSLSLLLTLAFLLLTPPFVCAEETAGAAETP